jgi:uncharacterized protein
MTMIRLLAGLALFTLLMSASDNYQAEIRAWQQHRYEGLRAPDSWLTLVGLYWLKPGNNEVEHVGRFVLHGNKVTFVRPDGSSVPLSYDEDKPDVIHSGTLSAYVIKRSDRFALRVKDSASPALKHFTGMKYFPINPEFRFQARFIPEEKKIPILNIVGQQELEVSPGIVAFSYKGQTYHLRPIYEGNTLFFLFKDPTNKTETYQAGRMLNTPLPVNGKVDLDFNKSYNPPCTFTPYATCPLPPKENTLPFPVKAGELRYGHGA